jgi:ABC-type phosphate/phosphonate transport system substrate-binding protein
MKINQVRRSVALILVSLLFPAFFQSVPIKSKIQAAPAVIVAEVVKVGITEYQNVEDSYDRYEELFQQLSESAGSDEPVTFSFAIGNYAEVLD